ncbi:MAG TPA: helical backbone metal receptor [Kofleriaceae bacterium]|nr:helical backbone metal receptor [Kofleriaceae bacterium]
MRCALIILAVLLGCGSKREPAPSAQSRIVSLMPSATEIVAALGATKELVGVDEYSDYPDEVKALPKVGSFLAPNLEVIVQLTPTLVIVDDIHGQVAGSLHDHGLATADCKMHALPDVKDCLRTVGAKLGRAKQADAVVEEIEHELDAAAAARPAKHPRVLVIIDRESGGLGNLVAAGPGSWVDELLAVVGGNNVLAASGVRYPKISLEEVISGDPEVIIDLSYDKNEARKAAAWKQVDVTAVRDNRVRLMDHAFLRGPSPRVKQALAALAEAIK